MATFDKSDYKGSPDQVIGIDDKDKNPIIDAAAQSKEQDDIFEPFYLKQDGVKKDTQEHKYYGLVFSVEDPGKARYFMTYSNSQDETFQGEDMNFDKDWTIFKFKEGCNGATQLLSEDDCNNMERIFDKDDPDKHVGECVFLI